MWLFDNVIAEEETSTTTTSQSQGGFTGGSTSDDGGFLILGDAPTTTQSYAAPEIKAEDIPDSAVSFLDLSALSSSPAASQESIVNIEETPIISEVKSNDEFSLFLDSAETPVSQDVTLDSLPNEVETNEESITMLEDADTAESFLNVQETTVEDKAPEEAPSMFTEMIEAVEAVIRDPLAILDKAINELQELLMGHAAVRNEKMATVDKINDQISTLKQEAKKLTEESKSISLEEEKVNKMIDTFKAQKV